MRFRSGPSGCTDRDLTGRRLSGAYVLSTGSVVLEGRAQDLLEDEAVRKEYLG